MANTPSEEEKKDEEIVALFQMEPQYLYDFLTGKLTAKVQTQKQYLAWVYGVLQDDTGEVNLPLRCDWPNRPKQIVDHELGKPSLTRFQVLERRSESWQTKVLLKPVTGRSHQLRVHMAELGHPISGCEFYAHPKALAQAQRLQLHAWKLSIIHPSTGTFEAHIAPPVF